ncbi:hypothetical protein KKA14_14900 [bacterium]|nr:hypothetical protein [bacterium]
MKKNLTFRVSVLIFCFVIVNANGYSQPTMDSGNIYTKWMKLALLGKNQAEIEYYFRNEKESSINRVKDRIRFSVLENLRRSGVKNMLQKVSDSDDFNVIIRKIVIEIRYAGMEHDEDLILSVKEQFGVELESL